MKRWVLTWSMGILFLLSVLEAIWASPQITMTLREDKKNVSYQQAFHFSHCSNLTVWGKIAPIMEFYDNGTCRFDPNVALQLTFPPLGPITMTFGNLTQDARITPFLKTGFSLSSLKEEDVGPLHATVLPLDKNEYPSVTLSGRFSQNLYAHMCTWTPMQEDVGFGGIATLVEWKYNNSWMRAGMLFAESKNREERGWIIPYNALPLSSGIVGYFQLIEHHTFSPLISIHATLLLRFSYDKAHGGGLTNSAHLKGSIGDFFWTLQAVDIPPMLGAIGQQAFKTIDAPLKQKEMTCGYRNRDVEILLAWHDSRWRPTPFAAMSQRRRLQWTGVISFALFSWDFHLQGRYEKRWNRSGSVGKSFKISSGFSGKVGPVSLRYEPYITWGSSVVFGGDFALGKVLSSIDTIQIRLQHKQQAMRVSGVWVRKRGSAQFKLEWHNDGRVAVTYSISPVR